MGKRALCVGINDFKNFPSAALNGCVNDSVDMKDVLKTFRGFTDADITTLTDAQATKANIMENLNAMVDGAKEGKYSSLVFSFSSHGTQIPDLSGDEDDRADEAFCPHDLAEKEGKWDPDHIISDDELHDLFVKLPEDVSLEVFMDTCHSGTGLKSIDFLLDRRPRYLPPPSLEAFEEIEGRHSRGIARALMETGKVDHILWSGCRADQTSADARIGGEWHGAFTYFYCKEMRDNENRLSREDLIKKIRKDLKDGRYTQIPQLEAEATKRKSVPA